MALLAPAFLWLNPVYVRLSGRWWPETLGIALTVGVLYTGLRYLETNDKQWYVCSLILLVLGVTNHMWEASIALPLFIAFLWSNEYMEATGVGITTLVAVGLTWWITHLQPSGASTLTHFGVHNDPSILLSLDWWNYITKFPIHPLPIARTFLLPIAILLLIYCVWRLTTDRNLEMAILVAWLFSGILIPIGLPLGADNHLYYLWAILAPFSIGISLIISEIMPADHPDLIPTFSITLASICTIAAMYILVFEAAMLGGTSVPIAGSVDSPLTGSIDGIEQGEAKTAGIELREYDIEHAQDIVFVGDWGQEQATQYHHTPAVSRVLIYSNVLIRDRGLTENQGPQFAENENGLVGCEVMVIRDGTRITTKAC